MLLLTHCVLYCFLSVEVIFFVVFQIGFSFPFIFFAYHLVLATSFTKIGAYMARSHSVRGGERRKRSFFYFFFTA